MLQGEAHRLHYDVLALDEQADWILELLNVEEEFQFIWFCAPKATGVDVPYDPDVVQEVLTRTLKENKIKRQQITKRLKKEHGYLGSILNKLSKTTNIEKSTRYIEYEL